MDLKEKIVVIGGGFSALGFIDRLDTKDKEVILIDRLNHHAFQPLFYQVATGVINPSDIALPFRKLFQNKKIDYKMTEVVEIVAEENRIVTPDMEIVYDKLVIATGCKTNFFMNENIEKYAMGLKSLKDAINIRDHIFSNFEKIDLLDKNNDLDEVYSNIVIVGNGPTGVELAGAIIDIKKNILPKEYPNIDINALRVILISNLEKPLSSMSKDSQNKAEMYLKNMGVEMIVDTVKDYDGNKVVLSTGKEIVSNTVIWAAGVVGNTIKGIKNDVVKSNRYMVDRYNRVKGYENIFAIGDIAYMETPLYPNAHPQVANVAINQGKNLAKNINNRNTKNWSEYEYKDLGNMAIIGKYKAVVDLPFIKFKGFLAWMTWLGLHLLFMYSFRNKLFTLLNWIFNSFGSSSLRFIINKK